MASVNQLCAELREVKEALRKIKLADKSGLSEILTNLESRIFELENRDEALRVLEKQVNELVQQVASLEAIIKSTAATFDALYKKQDKKMQQLVRKANDLLAELGRNVK